MSNSGNLQIKDSPMDVEWLRVEATVRRSNEDGICETLEEAADEIERLSRDNQILRCLVQGIDQIVEDETKRLREALESCQSWIERWAQHVGACEGGNNCTCGRRAVLYEAGAALSRD